MKILIVEDEALTATFLEQTLLQLHHTIVDIVDNAQACKDVLKQQKIDLILMDINIKGSVDGLQLAQEIHKQYPVKIIFITSYNDSKTIEEASLSSPIGFLIKPIIKSNIEAIMMIASTQLSCVPTKEKQESNQVSFGSLHYDIKKSIFTRNHEIVQLSKLETKAIELFLQNIDNSISSETLMYTLWNEEKPKSSIRELLSRLRKRLPELKLKNYSNIGYILYSN